MVSQIIKKSTLLLLFFVAAKITSAQSPWVNHKELYSQLSAGTIPAYSAVFKGVKRETTPLNGSLSEKSIQAYLEYGLTNKIAVVADIPYLFIASSDLATDSLRQAGTLSGLGNVGLGLKYNFINKKYLLTGQVNAYMPASKSEDATGLRTGYEAFSVVPTLSVGRGFNNSYFYSYVGARIFTDDLSSDVRFGAEFGRHFYNKLWLIGTFHIRESLNDGNRVYSAPYEDTHLYVNNQYVTNFAMKLIYEVNGQLGVNAAINILSIRANNLPFQRPFAMGVYYKLKAK